MKEKTNGGEVQGRACVQQYEHELHAACPKCRRALSEGNFFVTLVDDADAPIGVLHFEESACMCGQRLPCIPRIFDTLSEAEGAVRQIEEANHCGAISWRQFSSEMLPALTQRN